MNNSKRGGRREGSGAKPKPPEEVASVRIVANVTEAEAQEWQRRGRTAWLRAELRKQAVTNSFWVWENVLEDNLPGLVCVLAPDEETAWSLLKARDDAAWWVMRWRPDDRNDPRRHDELPDACRPREVTRQEAFVVWGG